MYAGIDYSITCPAITVGKTKKFKECKTFFYCKQKKFEGNFDHGIYGMLMGPYESNAERFDMISEWAMAILEKFKVTDVGLEGYSYGSRNGKTFEIGENTGILKHKLWKNEINYSIYPPTDIKKFFSGKGNANKEIMYDSFFSKESIDISKILNCNKKSSPVSDVIDSYAILCRHFSEI